METKFFHRDDSLLEFNRRVLEQALDISTPLLERVRFLAIFSGNSDEFFMKRIHRLREDTEAAARCRKTVLELMEARAKVWKNELEPALAKEGIQLLSWEDLSKPERKKASEFFQNEVYPLLTPLAVDPAHPFPFLSNLSLSLGVKLRRPDSEKPLFARIKIPDSLPQWIPLSSGPNVPLHLLRLTDLVKEHLAPYFPEMRVDKVMAFRVTRNAQVDIQSEDAEDLLDMVAEELRLRRVAGIVRVQHEPQADAWMLNFLKKALELSDEDFYSTDGELNDNSLFELASLDKPSLKYVPWHPKIPLALRAKNTDIFKVLRQRDLLVHFPYESFQHSVLKLIEDAARDKNVMAIKIALYRLGDNSPIIPLLIRAAEAGKQVVCVVELKARFDEARNIGISETLEKAGVHVVYGVVGLKTHSKICLVVRRESKSLRYYAHVGTGNYNPTTARSYTDFGFFTSDSAVCSDLLEIFNYLTGLSLRREYKKFLVAPVNMRTSFLELIAAEARNARKGLPSGIVAKMNSLEDKDICDALYDASSAGVKVNLIVRGLCCLKPGVKDLSENIRVTSVVGRFLEHSRCYHFRSAAKSAAKGSFYIGSADWMSRNLNSRVETLVPVEDPNLRKELWELLQAYLDDKAMTWELLSDGTYKRLRDSESGSGVQDKLMGRLR